MDATISGKYTSINLPLTPIIILSWLLAAKHSSLALSIPCLSTFEYKFLQSRDCLVLVYLAPVQSLAQQELHKCFFHAFIHSLIKTQFMAYCKCLKRGTKKVLWEFLRSSPSFISVFRNSKIPLSQHCYWSCYLSWCLMTCNPNFPHHNFKHFQP